MKNMNTKKLFVFLLFAFLMMVILGLLMRLTGGTSANTIISASNSDPTSAILGFLFSAAAMFIPLLSVVLTQLIFKEPILKGLGISFKINMSWLTGWLLIPIIAFATLGMTLLMPGAKWSTDNEIIQTALSQMPIDIGVWGIIAISTVSGLFAGLTINALFGFGEEIAWRGFLMKEFKGKKFLAVALLIGVIWGLWHAPIVLNGHNYPIHPLAGIFMMVALCILLTPILMYFRQKSGSVIVPAIMHGTFNALIGISFMVVETPSNDLLYGGAGLAGFIVLAGINLCLFLYDKFVSKENIFGSHL